MNRTVPHKSSESPKKVDPITLSVVRGGVISVCYEMGEVVERSSYSPIFTEGLDFSCSVFDGMGEEVAMHAGDVCHLVCMRFAVEWSLNEIGMDNLSPGDVVLCNDPYRGGNHVNDCTLFRPVFYKGKIVAIPAIRPHLLDLGGSAPGNVVGDATEIFQEGLRIPPIKMYSRGELDNDILKMILANVRDPRSIKGDIEAIIGALGVGERGIMQYVEKYGAHTFNDCLIEIKNASERFMRRSIREIPEGRYVAEDYLDDDGVNPEPLKIRVEIIVKGDTIIADFEGSSAQAAGPINATYAVTAGNTAIGLLHSIGIGRDIYVSEGCFRPIKVLVPPGTVVNVDYPGPCVIGNTDTGPRVADLVVAALSQAVRPEKTRAGDCGTCFVQTLGGTHPETGAQWVMYNFESGGQGARATKDGNSATFSWAQNGKVQSAEISETDYPIMVDEMSLVKDSAGPGKFRGGLGCRYVWRLLAPAAFSTAADRVRFSPHGVFGGLPPKPLSCGHASCTKISLNGQQFRHGTQLFGAVSLSKWGKKEIHAGDVIETIITGGGGFGDPLERDPERVLQDLIREYISNETAREFYGVVIDEEKMKLDSLATDNLRKKMKGET